MFSSNLGGGSKKSKISVKFVGKNKKTQLLTDSLKTKTVFGSMNNSEYTNKSQTVQFRI